MPLNKFAYILALILWTTGCGGQGSLQYSETGPSLIRSAATISDMMNILEDGAIKKPYSQYLYRIMDAKGNETASGIVSVEHGGDENVKLAVTESELEVTIDESLQNLHDITKKGPFRLPVNGGYLLDNRVVIMPGLYKPVEFHPPWFPSQAALSVNTKGDLLVRVQGNFTSETQRLIAFMDAHRKLEGVKCEVLGTFDSMAQLKKLVTIVRGKGRNGDQRYYVLRLSRGNAFALVTINLEKGLP